MILNSKWSIGWPIFAATLGASWQAAAGSLSYEDLVGRMTNLAYLATLPQPGDTCAQWSSYDRASRYDAPSGKYINWGANGDGSGIIRKEGDQSVMAEMEGPGCIWRIWSAQADRGHVKIYIDGQSTPVIDMPFGDYFDGQHAPFNYKSLSYNLADQKSRGQNLYLPIPYQKSCKVVADKGWGSYFHFTYETFPKGTTVPVFSAGLAADQSAALARVDRFFSERLGSDPAGARPGEQTVKSTFSLAPGQTVRAADLSGSRAITAIRVKNTFGAREDQIAALCKISLRIRWDGQDKPAVWCPLGDFFGTAPGVNLYKSFVTGMTPEVFYALWYMPFEKTAIVELVSEDTVPREIGFELVHAPLGRPFAGLGYFHAKWHRDVFELPADRAPDWVMLRAGGQGRFCGVMLHVWNPHGGWWGEGDEKFFVDGEKFPSTIGTGSEDYFGYAWCDPHLFQRAYHAQTMTQNNQGHQSVLRWHIVDNIPFQNSFEACIEKYFSNQERGTLYACTACWYLAPGGADPFEPVPVADRYAYWTNAPLTAAGFAILNEPQAQVQTQDMKGYASGKWQNNQQLWWTGAHPGSKLDLAVSAPSPSGSGELVVYLTKAPDYGIVQFYLDDVKYGEPIDLYAPGVAPSGPIHLGRRQIPPGRRKLTVEIIGANPKAAKAYMFGMDRIAWID